MTMRSQDYAELASDAYRDRPVGVRAPDRAEPVTIGGVDYRILEHVDDRRTGYQGTMYQRVDSGEIVVAHRGTEQFWRDGVVTDGGMVLARINPQAEHAIALTRRALDYARREGEQPGATAPEVTVTGHSLGGTLAQVSAHHFDLRGETFNAYGAASLNRRIPEGGNRVLNHVMAADAVSAASPHYGQVRMYAEQREISTLQLSGYHNNRLLDAVTPNNPLLAAGTSLGSHSMHKFLPVDGDGRPDQSVLDSPQAQRLAADNQRMIQVYRNEVGALRGGITSLSRGPGGLVQDGIDALRGPLPAGEPARREQQLHPTPSLPQSRAAPAVPVGPRYPELYDDPGVFKRLTGFGEDDAQVRPPLRAPLATEPARTHLGPLQQTAAEARSHHVAQLLLAARDGNPEALRAATEGLRGSAFGLDWQQKVDALVRGPELVQNESQRQTPPAELAR